MNLRRDLICRVSAWLLACLPCLSMHQSWAQDAARAPSETGPALIDFQRDVAPILARRCLECHGPKDAKEDVRVDERDSLMSYVEPGALDASPLWTDFLRATDPEMLMPPAQKGGPLSAAELLVIKAWIEEGAVWPDGVAVVAPAAGAPESPVTPADAMPETQSGRLWAAAGYFHPAVIHFPIGLLLTSALFVVIGVVWPAMGQLPAKACLFVGALTSVVACLMGFALAEQQGYGGWQRGMDAPIFWHRWGGVLVAVLSTMVAMLAAVSSERGANSLWKLSVLVIALLVGWVGHEGGELTYGSDFYSRAFQLLGFQSPDSMPAQSIESGPQSAGERTEQATETAKPPSADPTPAPTAREQTPSPKAADEPLDA
jgi:uncharacterized membrane protein